MGPLDVGLVFIVTFKIDQNKRIELYKRGREGVGAREEEGMRKRDILRIINYIKNLRQYLKNAAGRYFIL